MAEIAHVLICLVLAVMPVWAQSTTHLYSPGTNLEQSELAQLRTAIRSVDVAMYSFTDRELAEELAALARKGVRVRVYRDREQSEQEMQRSSVTTTGILLAAGIEVRIKGVKDLMHLKSYAIDGRLLRTGSANWSPTGLKRQITTYFMKAHRRRPKVVNGPSRTCGVGQRIQVAELSPFTGWVIRFNNRYKDLTVVHGRRFCKHKGLGRA